MLNALLLADLRNVNQSFLHAQILYDIGLRTSGEQGYKQSVLAMNRSMRLMLAMLAAGKPIGFDDLAADDPLGALQLERDPAAIYAADLTLLDRLLAQLRRTRALLPDSEIALHDLIEGFEAEHRKRRDWIGRMHTALRGFDAVLSPTVPILAPPIAQLEASDEAFFGTNAQLLRNTIVANLLDGCAITLPCQAPGTAPVGLMLWAPGLRDDRLLDTALAVEAALLARTKATT